jgi:nucleoside-diphosphate kinase
MAVEQTLSIIKPDGVQKNLIGDIYSRFEQAGLQVVAARMMHLTTEQAEGFYVVHKDRPFYADLVNYMMSGPVMVQVSGPVMVQVLEGDDAISKNRGIMGATNPADADPGTIRADFADSIEENIVHGSDGPDTAADEIEFFFGNDGICPRTR